MPAAVSNVYTHLRKLLTESGPERTYRATTGRYEEFEDIETKSSPNVLGHPLVAALLRALGLAPLAKSYNKLLSHSIIDLRPEFELYARSVLAEPVQKYLFSDKPSFEKYIASIDNKTKDDLAGRYLAALLMSAPQRERAVVGAQAYDETLRDKLVMDLTMRLYPGAADIAAQELIKWYHAKYGPIVRQMTPDEIRSAVTSYVNMFEIGPADREIAVKRILSDPARTSVAIGVVHGGESLHKLKSSLAERFGKSQVQPTVEKLITSPGDERLFRTSAKIKRPVVAKLYTYPQIRSTPASPGLVREIGEYLGIFSNPLDIKPETASIIDSKDINELELILGEVEAASEKVDHSVKDLGPKEWDRLGEVLEHLHSKFGDRLPALSVRRPPTPAFGLYYSGSHEIHTIDNASIFFHELGHALNRPVMARFDTKRWLASEIASDALSMAVMAYVKGFDDHPLVQLAKRAGLLPGGSDVVKTPIDWAVEDVFPYILKIGPKHSRRGDFYINSRREYYEYSRPMTENEQSRQETTPVINVLTRGF